MRYALRCSERSWGDVGHGTHAGAGRPRQEQPSAAVEGEKAREGGRERREADPIDETILENGATHDSAVAVLVDEVTPQIVVHESGNDGAVSEITSNEDAGEIAAAALVAVEIELQPAAADDGATQARAVQEDDNTGAAKRAIIHEWENWSALHSDELGDPNVAEYFFRHLETKKGRLLDFISDNKQKTVFGLLLRNA